MKISELITRLNKIKDYNGDIDIIHPVEDDKGFLSYKELENSDIYVEEFEEIENKVFVIIE